MGDTELSRWCLESGNPVDDNLSDKHADGKNDKKCKFSISASLECRAGGEGGKQGNCVSEDRGSHVSGLVLEANICTLGRNRVLEYCIDLVLVDGRELRNMHHERVSRFLLDHSYQVVPLTH